MGYDDSFWQLENELEMKHKTFLMNSPEINKTKILVVGSAQLNSILNELSQKEDLKENYLVKISTLLLTKQVNYFFAIFELMKGFYYNPATALVRTTYENFLLLKGLAENPEKAKEIYQAFKKDIEEREKLKDIDKIGYYLRKPEYVKILNKIIKKQRKSQEPVYEKVYDFMSNVSTHPHQFDQLTIDSKPNEGAEKTVLEMTINVLYGTLIIVKKILKEQLTKKNLSEIETILKKIEKNTPDGIMTFTVDK